MVHSLIDWALSNRIIVLLATAAVATVGYFCFLNINVEAYPDPAPAIVEIVAQWSGASAEEMERLVTIPLEVSLAGMPGLKVNYSKSLFGLTHLRCIFQYGFPYKDARQEVINRLSNLTVPVPNGVNPVISPASPIGEIYRYTLKTPKNSLGEEIYTLNDIKALEDWFIERHFRRVPRIIDISSFGGTVKRYEIQPDPERLKRFGITLNNLQNALTNSNGNVGGDFLVQGKTAQVVRCVGNIAGGKDPMEIAFSMRTPEEAAAYLREEEQKRLREIRKIVIATVNNIPVKIEDIVVGGPLVPPDAPSTQGVVVFYQTRLGMITQDKSMDSYQITDDTLTWLRKHHVPEEVLTKLAILKDKNFDSKQHFLKGLAKDRFNITDAALEKMRAGQVPQSVLTKLASLKNEIYESRELLNYELDKILSRDEVEVYRDPVLEHARLNLLNKEEFSRYNDLVVEYAEGIRYVLTDKSLGALRSKEVPEGVVNKLGTLKDNNNEFIFLNRGYKNREIFVKALAKEVPELQERFKVTDKSLSELRNEGVPAAVLQNLEKLKGKGYKNAILFSDALADALGRDVIEAYELTDKSFAELRSIGVAEAVLTKLTPLKNKGFKTPKLVSNALAEALDKHELKRYQDVIFTDGVKRLQDIVSSHCEEEFLQDVVLNQAAIHWRHQEEKVQGVVLMRKGEESLPSIEGVKKKVEELNQPGRLLPGVELETYYDREDLVHLTTHTVRENLVLGIVLVVVILMMFLSNIKTAVIVAINIPIALLFAFIVLYFRGESANLLSIGAVDFGIIVDSAVIMTENIFRNLSTGAHAELPLKERILKSTREIDRALFFSTAIMVVAFVPLFTMKGAEGQLFGPMSQTYAFALGGALLMAFTLTPVLCSYLLKNVKPVEENLLVWALKIRYQWKLKLCLRYPKTLCLIMGLIIGITALWPMMHLGREFMPELEEGSLWIRAMHPVNSSLETVKNSVQRARKIMCSESYPEVSAVLAQMGRPDDGTDPGLFNCVEVFVPLRKESDWPIVDRPSGERKKRTRREIVSDMSAELSRKLPGVEWQFSQYIRDNVMEAISGVKGDNCVKIFGPDLDKLEELAEKTKAEMSKVKGLHDLGIYRVMGQSNLEFVVDKDKCLRYGVQVADINAVIYSAVHGNAVAQMVEGEKMFDITVRWPFNRRWDRTSILEIPVDIWNNSMTSGYQAGANQTIVSGPSAGPAASGNSNAPPAPISVNQNYIASAYTPRLYLKHFVSPISRKDWRPDPDTRVIHAGSLTLAKPQSIIDLKLVAGKTYVFDAFSPDFEADFKLLDARGEVVWPANGNGKNGHGKKDLGKNGPDGLLDPELRSSYTPRMEGTYYLVVTPVNEAAFQAALRQKKAAELKYTATVDTMGGNFSRPAGSIITREDGKRFIAVKFAVWGDRDLASVVGEVRDRTKNLFEPPYYISMGGEFEQMEDGEKRLMFYIPFSLLLIFLLLYVAFRSLLDAIVILSNVFDLAVGGVWALYLTGTNFSMSAAVGFVSLFGVAIMEGLLMISYFNTLRAHGLELHEAIVQGSMKRVRPVMITAMTAILGLLPAALSTSIGAQTQRPLAIVVVGGMIITLFLDRYLMPVLYSFYGHRTPPESAAASMGHE